MSPKNSSEFKQTYKERSTEDDSTQTEHAADDRTEHKAYHQPEKNGDGQSVAFKDKFNAELRGIDDRAAAVFDPKGNIAEYTAEDRKSFVTSYIKAFNSAAPEDKTERWNAARETADLVFKPLYEEVELKEAVGYANISPELAQTMEENDVKLIRYITNTPDENGNNVDYENVKHIEFKVDSIEKAKAIIEASGGEAYIVDPTALDLRKDEFAATLNASYLDEQSAANLMGSILEDAIAYTKSEDYTHPEPTEFANLHQQEDSQVLDNIIASNLAALSTKTRKSLDHLARDGNEHSQAAHFVAQAHLDTYHQMFEYSITNNNEDQYHDLTSKLQEFDAQFSQTLEQNTGFIKAENYQQPTIPEDFTDPDAARAYIDEVNTVLEKLNPAEGDIEPINHRVLSQLTSQLQTEFNITYPTDTDMEWSTDTLTPLEPDDYEPITKLAKSVNYILQPHQETNREEALAAV